MNIFTLVGIIISFAVGVVGVVVGLGALLDAIHTIREHGKTLRERWRINRRPSGDRNVPWFTRHRSSESSEEINSPVSELLPHTTQEQYRLSYQHYMMRTILGGNITAPLSAAPAMIVDIGCGTGQWVLEVARAMPGSIVVGIDLEIPQVNMAHPYYPRNCSFERLNVLEPFPYMLQSIDYLHLRFMSSSIPLAMWSHVFHCLASYLKPGGWIEWVEVGAVFDGSPALNRLCKAWDELGRQRGHLARPGSQIAQTLQTLELINITYRPVRVPLGAYGGQIGRMTAQDGIAIFHALRPGILNLQTMTPQEFDWCLGQVQVELNDPRNSLQTTVEFAIAYGQRGTASPATVQAREKASASPLK